MVIIVRMIIPWCKAYGDLCFWGHGRIASLWSMRQAAVIELDWSNRNSPAGSILFILLVIYTVSSFFDDLIPLFDAESAIPKVKTALMTDKSRLFAGWVISSCFIILHGTCTIYIIQKYHPWPFLLGEDSGETDVLPGERRVRLERRRPRRLDRQPRGSGAHPDAGAVSSWRRWRARRVSKTTCGGFLK